MSLVDVIRTEVTNLFERFIDNTSVVNFLTIVVMVIFWLVLGFIVTRIVRAIVLKTSEFQDKTTKEGLTMRRLINNIIKALFMLWIILMILQELGIDVLPVLAGAGVIAFAIGFGAQELIKDVISGFFLILEKTFSIGDTIEISGDKGTVIDIGLRRTKIQTWKNDIVTINNGDIKKVINYSINDSVAVIDFNIDFRKDIELFYTDEFNDFIKDFIKNQQEIINEGSKIVVSDLLGGHVTLRITFETNNRKNVLVEREFRKELLKYTKEHNIDLEVPLVLEQDQLK